MADYMTTYSKIRFYPLNPMPKDILIEDIAHALSLMTRAGGHFPEFYSVGQHCIFCCREALSRGYSDRLALACLLHDAGEAYMADIIRPVKQHMPGYVAAEEHLLTTIYTHFLGSPLTTEEQQHVTEVDNSLLCQEFIYYMQIELEDEQGTLVSQPEFGLQPFKEVEEEYLKLFAALS